MRLVLCVRVGAFLGSLACLSTPLVALNNNVLLVSDSENPVVAQSWLAEYLPPTVTAKSEKAVAESKPYVEPISGEIRFTPLTTPGASFQQSGDEFSEYRKKMAPEY